MNSLATDAVPTIWLLPLETSWWVARSRIATDRVAPAGGGLVGRVLEANLQVLEPAPGEVCGASGGVMVSSISSASWGRGGGEAGSGAGLTGTPCTLAWTFASQPAATITATAAMAVISVRGRTGIPLLRRESDDEREFRSQSYVPFTSAFGSSRTAASSCDFHGTRTVWHN